MLKSKKVKTNGASFDAFQFTGKNGKDIVAWVDKNDGVATAGGAFVDLLTADGGRRMLKHSWVLKDVDGKFYVVGDALFLAITSK